MSHTHVILQTNEIRKAESQCQALAFFLTMPSEAKFGYHWPGLNTAARGPLIHQPIHASVPCLKAPDGSMAFRTKSHLC